MHRTAHVDTFARDHLPPPDQWPKLDFDLPELQFPERMNCATQLNATMRRTPRKAIPDLT